MALSLETPSPQQLKVEVRDPGRAHPRPLALQGRSSLAGPRAGTERAAVVESPGQPSPASEAQERALEKGTHEVGSEG